MDMNVSMSSGRTPEEQEAHDAAMAAKAEETGATSVARDTRAGREDHNVEVGTVPPTEEAAESKRPEGIPEKFWDADKGEVNVEALLKAQQDAEAELRKQQGEEPKEEQAETPENTATEGESQASVVEQAAAEYAKTGDVGAEMREALAKVGITAEMVDSHIQGVKAVESQLAEAAYAPFEGRENFDAALEWAAVNMTEDESAAYDVQLTSTNPAIVKQGAEALKRAYMDANPDEGNTLRGDGNTGHSGEYFKSGAEMRAAMADPRYKTDPAFRESVAQKIARADKAGVTLF